MIVTGCTEGPRQTNRQYREVGLAAFASSEAEAQAQPVDADETESDAVSDEPWFDDEAYVGVPMEPGERTVVDSMVGQVNGQPIFADAFFDPIEDELIALSEELPPREYGEQMQKIVANQLNAVVLNALFLAEARGGLSQEEKFGVLAWLRNFEESLVAKSGGNRVEMERRLREEEGTTVEGKLQNIEDEALIQKLLAEEIRPRVIVSWRDVELEYERQYDKFNPPGSIKVARIRIPTSRTESIADVSARLAAGEDFMELVKSTRQRLDGEWETFAIGADGKPDTSPLREDLVLIKEKVAELGDQGDYTQPFEVGNYTWWLYAEEFDRPEARSLFDPDVQRLLSASIRGRRGAEEQKRYIDSLFAEGIDDDIQDMLWRLLQIAERRYPPR